MIEPDFSLFEILWVRVLVGFILGGILGSFSTVLAYRLPRRLSIIWPRSHCPACKTTLKARDLVPLISWLSTTGHCRYCQGAIGPRYFAIELATSAAAAIAAAWIGFSPWLMVAFAIIVVVVVAAAWQ